MHDRYILLHRYSDLDESKHLILEARTLMSSLMRQIPLLKNRSLDQIGSVPLTDCPTESSLDGDIERTIPDRGQGYIAR